VTAAQDTASVPEPHRRPEPGEPRPYHFPDFERRSLSNGLRLVIAPVHKLPIVTLLAIIDAGAVADPADQDGIALLTARLLTEGTARLDGAQLSERMERLGASFDAHADWDVAIARVTAMTDHASEALGILAEVLRSPAFPEREVERLKAERTAEILQQRAEPRGLADEGFSRVVYATGSRYALPDGGRAKSVQAMTADDVRAYYESRYRPGGVTLVIVGDIGADAAERMAERALVDWKGEAPAPAGTIDAPASSERLIHLIPKADAPQSELRVGHPGVSRSHPDYFPLVVMNAILGGLFSSRINLNLREEHGYTYGAFSGFAWRRQAGPFLIETAVKSEVTDAAVREILHEVERMRSTDVTPEELSLATSYLGGVFPIRYESTDAIASALAGSIVHGLPDDWFDAYRTRIASVTASDVRRVAEAHLRPDQMQVVCVGDASVVREPLAALGVGEIREHAADAGIENGEEG
jgi:zinc protease